MSRKISMMIAALAVIFANDAYASAGWTNYVQVAELVPTARHYYEVRLPVKDNPSGCREENWFYLNYDAPGSKQMFAVLLEAIQSDIRLRVYVSGICNLNGYAEITSINLTR